MLLSSFLDTLIHFDRVATLALNGNSNLFLDNVMSALTYKFVWILAGLSIAIVIFRNNNWRKFLLIVVLLVLCVTFADQLSSHVIKPLCQRLRPTHDPAIMDQIDIVGNYRGGHHGFVSSHAANCWAVAMFLMRLFHRRVMTLVLLFWAIVICYTRIYMGVHYLGDILGGAALGILIGLLLYSLYAFMVRRNVAGINRETDRARGHYRNLSLIYGALLATYVGVVAGSLI